MAKRIWLVLGLAILLAPQIGAAQVTCSPFKGLLQWTAGPEPFHGPAYAVFENQVWVDDDADWLEWDTETCNAGTCHARGGKLLLDFGNGNSLTLTVQHGTYIPSYTTLPGFGTWQAVFGILEGTGRFLGASGVLVQEGTWVTWVDETGFHGRFSAPLEGNVCIGHQ